MRGPAIRDKVLALVDPLRLFTDGEGTAYMLHPRTDRFRACEYVEVVALRSREGRLLLTELYLAEHRVAPSSQGLAEGIAALEAVAHGAAQAVGLRVMAYKDGIALDLADDTWTRVVVTKSNWCCLGDGPLFRRGEGALALPRPLAGGDWQALRPFVNVASDDDLLLLLVWLTFALRPGGPYPILVLQGEQGSSKSTIARVLVMLIDPGLVPLAPAPKDSQHLMVMARARHVLAIDNLSRIEPGFKDDLCRLATGAGHLARRLYTDGDAVCWRACRPIILNGIDNLLVADDLTDRSIVLTLPPIPEQARRTEADFWRDFKRQRGLLLGVLLDAVSTGLGDVDRINLPRIPRMADFARWGAAVAPCFGATAEEFLAAYETNRRGAVESGIEGSAPGRALLAFMEGRKVWSGTFGQLLAALNESTGQDIQEAHSWPRSPRGLQNAVRRLAPALRAVGLRVEECGRTKAGAGIVLAWGDCGDGGEGGSYSNLFFLHSNINRGGPSLPSLGASTVTSPSPQQLLEEGEPGPPPRPCQGPPSTGEAP